jgi:sugar/nucleoside kinase (ribokinase family)/ADP-ribose pyrophosphatase YjhB (NUDIX family)
VGPEGDPEVRLPKGHIEPGESRRETALREVREETGLSELEILADLGHQTVEFDWQGRHYVRHESYFLMCAPAPDTRGHSEAQFVPQWLPWGEALSQTTFEAEREWLRRAYREVTSSSVSSRRGANESSRSGPDIVGLGYCVYDIVAITSGPPDFDNVAMTPLTSLVHDGGGQVGTALTAAARLGARTGYVGLLGDEPEGRWLRDRFVKEGVEISRLRLSDENGTNICLILVEEATARRAILCHRRVQPVDLVLDEQDRLYIQNAQVLHLDGQFMPAAIQAAQWAREAGVRISYDGNHKRPRLEELLPMVDWLVVAEPFPTTYTGLPDLRDAAQALLDLGPEVLVVTEGQRGCQVWTAATHFQVPGFTVKAVDTTGAGDAFHGAFVHAMLQGWELARVATFANAVAALNCQTLGGRRGLPDAETVHLFLDRVPKQRQDH